MKKNQQEMKKILKPLIKQCIKEVLFEEGVLSTIISEVVKGTSGTQLFVENKQQENNFDTKIKQAQETKRKQILENRKRMLAAVGSDAYNGVNVFEGTTPAPEPASDNKAHSPLSGVDPNDPGVDISSLLASAGSWKKVIGK